MFRGFVFVTRMDYRMLGDFFWRKRTHRKLRWWFEFIYWVDVGLFFYRLVWFFVEFFWIEGVIFVWAFLVTIFRGFSFFLLQFFRKYRYSRYFELGKAWMTWEDFDPSFFKVSDQICPLRKSYFLSKTLFLSSQLMQLFPRLD